MMNSIHKSVSTLTLSSPENPILPFPDSTSAARQHPNGSHRIGGSPNARLRMRHLHFTQSLEPLQGGGLGSSSAALQREFLAYGALSVLCSTHGSTPQRPAPGTQEFRRMGPGFLYYSPSLHREAPQLVRQADVLHGHGLYVGTNYIFGREARRQGKPLVYHVHGMFEPWILNRSRWKKRPVHWLFENANFRQVRLWRALTSKEAGQIRALGITAPVIVAPNGLNPGDYPRPADPSAEINTPLIRPLKKSGPRLLFLGRLHPKKGLDLLVAAWMKLREVRKDWELIIAGPDEGGHLSQLRLLAGPDSVREKLLFTGAVTGQSKNALLHSADLFVLPSYSEGFPMSLLEALACEVPVVATRSCNFPEISTHETGWECDATVESLTETLRTALVVSEAERKERGRNGRRLVETNYAWPRIVSTLLEACGAHC